MRKIKIFILFILTFGSGIINAQDLNKLFNREMFSVDRAYFEKFAGVPKYVDDRSYSYNVKNCLISIATNDKNQVVRMGLNAISSRCSVNLSKSGFVFSSKNLKDLRLGDVILAASDWSLENDSCLSTRGTGQLILELQFVIKAEMPGVLGRIQMRVTTWGKESEKVAELIETMYSDKELCLYGNLNKDLSMPLVKKLIEKEMLGSRIKDIELFY